MLNLVTAILKTRTKVFQINETHNSFHFTCNALDLGRNFYWKISRPLGISIMPVKECLGDYSIHYTQGAGYSILYLYKVRDVEVEVCSTADPACALCCVGGSHALCVGLFMGTCAGLLAALTVLQEWSISPKVKLHLNAKQTQSCTA